MGMLRVTVRVERPDDPGRFFSEKFWVDAGALYTFVPEDRLTALGIEPLYSRDLILADGRRERRLLGEARLSIEQLGESITCPVIFAPPGSLYLLGATALEAFGVDVDPTTKRLRPILGIIGGFIASAGSDSPDEL
jgi:predicted aspartyl protease